jgi:hypothetical protein
MKESVTLTREEQKRLVLAMELDARRVKAGQAAGVLGLSTRQVKRLLAAYRMEGAAGLAHGKRGSSSHHGPPREVWWSAGGAAVGLPGWESAKAPSPT